ncbi:jerky protein homolog-like [Anoplophora glabripennis]|uniref:jerky protein homolog-like n=1 Tax=Anoplophora glabripennis TaxID=217634 RepID=UPI0008741E2D|nr:jerky protein homolog-like [Anoplophora glabripennis]
MASQASFKRKHKTLNIEDKLQILEKLKKGESGAALAREFGVGKSTITDIKSKQDAILKYASQQDSNEGPKNRKRLKLANNMALEAALYLWFTQRRSLGEPISGPLLCEKALDFNKQLNGSPDFNASSGWLAKFKQ